MAENLEWIFALVDRMSAPSLKIAESLDKMSAAIDRAGQKSSKGEKDVKSFGERISEANEHAADRAVDRFVESLTGVEFAFKAAEAVGELVAKLAELGVELVEDAIKAATFEQKTDIVFRALTHTEAATKAATDGAKAFALESGIALDQVVGSYQRLLFSGTKLKDIPILLQAATDVGFLTGNGKSSSDALLNTFEHIKSMGKLTSLEFRGLRAALPIEGFDKLAKTLGFTATEGGRFKGEAIEGQKAIRAILEMLAKFEGGKLGTVTEEMAHTLPAIATNAKNNFDLLLGSIEKTTGFKNLLVVAEKFVALLDPASPTGRALVETFGKAADAVGEFLEPLTHPGAAQAFLDMIVEDVKEIGDVLEAPIDLVLTFVAAWEAVNEAIDESVDAVAKLVDKISNLSLGDVAHGAGRAGLAGATGGLSEVAFALGLPQFAEGGTVPGSGPQLAVVHGGETVVPAGGGGGGVNLSVTQHIHVGGDAHSGGADMARHIAEIGAAEIVQALENAAVQAGRI